MKKFFLTFLSLVAVAGVAFAQEVIATIDYTKLREYPYGEQGFTTEIVNRALVLTDGHDWPQCTIIADVECESDTEYTVTVGMKGDKKGAAALVVGNWADNDWKNSADPISFTTKWEACSTVITTGTCTEPVMFRFQPNNYADVMEIAWVVVSKGNAAPASTPDFPVSLDNIVEDQVVDFSTMTSYPYETDAEVEIVDGVLSATGSEIFNLIEGIKLEDGLKYGIILKAKASEECVFDASLGNWGAMNACSFNVAPGWYEEIIAFGYPAKDEDTGEIPEENFVMLTPPDGFEGTIDVAWVKLVHFLEPEPEPEPTFKYVWETPIENLTGDNGKSDNVYTRITEDGEWKDVVADVCDNPAGEGKVFFGNVEAHPYPEDPENDPIPDHSTQFFIHFPDNVLQEGDSLRVSFDYYETIERNIDTQAHYTPGAYNFYQFIGSFTAKPEWQHYEAAVEVTASQAGSMGCATITLNLATRDNANQTDMPESIFYMNNITVKVAKLVQVDNPGPGDDQPGDEPKLEWKSIITSGNANDGESENILARVDGEDIEAKVVDNPAGDGKVFEAPIIAKTDGVNDWDSQMFIKFDQAIEEGTEIKVSFEYYCTNERTVQTQAHGLPGNYHHWEMLGNLEAKPEWQTLEKTVKITADQVSGDCACEGCQAIAFNLSTTAEAGTFYLKNVKVEALLPAANDAVEPIKAVVKAIPGVYNLHGVKVADSIDEVAVPGLYITNGKKVIKK